MMDDSSKTSGVPRHQDEHPGHVRPAPGGSSSTDDPLPGIDENSPPRHALRFLIDTIRQLRDSLSEPDE